MKPFASFLRIEAAAGAILLAVTTAALVLSNSPWAHQFLGFWELPVGIRIGSLEAARSLRDSINDALMTLLFFVVALELERELVFGELRNPALAAAVDRGGRGWHARPCRHLRDDAVGSEVPMAGASPWRPTPHSSFAPGRARAPHSAGLRVFMLSLAIIDDIGAILVVAIGYGGQLDWAHLLSAGSASRSFADQCCSASEALRSLLVGGLTWLAVDDRHPRHRHWRRSRSAGAHPEMGKR